MKNTEDFKSLESELGKLQSFLFGVKKIISILQQLIGFSKPNLSEVDKNSQAIEKIFEIYEKALKKTYYKRPNIYNSLYKEISDNNFGITQDTLRYFHDLLKYTLMKEAAQELRATLSPQAYLRELNSESISSLYAFLEGISVHGHIANVMKDEEKKKIDNLLEGIESTESDYKAPNWRGIAILLKEALKSILNDKSSLPTMTVRRIGTKGSSRTLVPVEIGTSKIDIHGEAKKLVDFMSENPFSEKRKDNVSQRDDFSP